MRTHKDLGGQVYMSDEGTEKNANILPVLWYAIKKNAFIKQVANNQRQRSNNVGMATIAFSLAQKFTMTLTLDSAVHFVL